MMLSKIDRTRLEKAAIDNGFDLELPGNAEWLAYASTQCSLRVWIRISANAGLLVALSQQNVAEALGEYGTLIAVPLPLGAAGGRSVADIPGLHRLLRRAFQLSRTLPDELLHVFQRQTARLPKTTEAERLIVQRIGQDLFRQGLLDFWEGRCAITGLAVPELLHASHIKPWADCNTDAERLDIFNGFLLAPHLDAAFDQGFITIDNAGWVIVSDILSSDARSILSLNRPLQVARLDDRHLDFLMWHHQHVFQNDYRSGPGIFHPRTQC